MEPFGERLPLREVLARERRRGLLGTATGHNILKLANWNLEIRNKIISSIGEGRHAKGKKANVLGGAHDSVAVNADPEVRIIHNILENLVPNRKMRKEREYKARGDAHDRILAIEKGLLSLGDNEAEEALLRGGKVGIVPSSRIIAIDFVILERWVVVGPIEGLDPLPDLVDALLARLAVEDVVDDHKAVFVEELKILLDL